MKRVLLTLVAAVITTGAFAQINFGVRVGGNLSTISGMVEENNGLDWGDLASANASQAMKLGLNAGVYAEYMVVPMFLGVQVEANFSMQGVNTSAEASSGLLGGGISGNTTYAANYINVPILAKFHLLKFRAYVGPQIGFALGMNTTTETTLSNNVHTKEGTINTLDLSLVVGAQYKLTRNIGIDARYNIGLTDVFPAVTNSNGEELIEAWGKQGVLQLGVFFEF